MPGGRALVINWSNSSIRVATCSLLSASGFSTGPSRRQPCSRNILGGPPPLPTLIIGLTCPNRIKAASDLQGAGYEISHGGYDGRYVQADPDRLVPVDVLREIEQAGTIGKLHDQFLSTSGLANPLANSRRLGREMAEQLKKDGVDAVIPTST
ncbi:MAG: glycine/betaine/sarcosine/D-proline family reductase selenoprotein B [Dehalococcoidia bacterium]|nr:glycine/betaine/sarcosine/D-proline family reductase selenoprotein B [Dehalococcoidia bacterium]